jgi:hypothetical protein
VGKHRLEVQYGGYSSEQVKVELIAYDTAGNVLSVLPVATGFELQLGSKLSPSNWKFKLNAAKQTAEMYAPLPIVKVTASDGTNRSEAYCSNIPYLDVLKPTATSVASADGGVQVLAMIPRVDDNNLQILVDGVDLFAALQVSPTACTPSSPCGGTANINGTDVEIKNLIVDNAETIGALASNTVSFTMNDLSCGGHGIVVQGQRAEDVRISPLAAQCYKDDLADSAVATVFAIDIASPEDNASGLTFPVTVQGEACHGRPITVLDINGLQSIIPSSDLVVTQVGGINTYKLPFSKQLPQTDLASDLAGTNATLGTLDAGSNRVVATATDDLGNRAYDAVIVATGTTENPGIPPAAAQLSSAMKTVTPQLNQIIANSFPEKLDINNAFIATLSKDAVQKHFDERCKAAETTYKAQVTQNIQNHHFDPVEIRPTCSENCDTTPAVRENGISFTGSASCPVSFHDGEIHVTINMPDVKVFVDLKRNCGECGVTETRTEVDATSEIDITNVHVDMVITENQIVTGAQPTVVGTLAGTSSHHETGGVETPCFISQACGFLISVVTLGFVNVLDVSVDLSGSQDFTQEIGASEPDPIKVQDIKVDETKVAAADQTVSGKLTQVRITPDGLVAGLKGTFATDSVDPDIAITPGALRTAPTPIPLPAYNTVKDQGGKDISILLPDDTLNMMFASMALSGKLKTECEDSGKTLSDIIPDVCDDISVPAGESATALAQGACHGIRGNSCESITAANGLLTALKQGACHGIIGDNCSTIPVSATQLLAQTERETCSNTPNAGLLPTMPLMFCSKQEMPPRPALLPGGSTNNVPVGLRLNDLSVALILDRNANQVLDGDLTTLPQCFGDGAPNVGDCIAYALCLDANLNFNMSFATCDAGTPAAAPGFSSTFVGVQDIQEREKGKVCGGSGPVGNDALMTGVAGASNSVVTTTLGSKGQQFAPPICAKGFDLGGLVSCASPALVSVNDTGGDPNFKDLLGITCSTQ